MFSENSSIEQGFNYPETNKQLAYPNRKVNAKFKRKNKEPKGYEDVQEEKQEIKSKNKFFFKIQVIKNVGRFINNLKAGIVLQQPNLKQNQLYYLQSETKQNEKEDLIKYEKLGMILLESIVIIFLWVNLWKSSFQIIFSRFQFPPIIEAITLLVYISYIYLFLNTQIKNEKMELISNREIILEYYKSQRMVYDIIIILTLLLKITPLDHIESLGIIFRILTIFSLKPANEIGKKLENIISVSTDAEIIFSILSLFFKIFLLLHCLSLAFTILSKIQKSRGIETTWVQGNRLNVTSQLQQYICGWYWGATVLSTVGFGDITPVNHIERFFCSFIEVMCCVMFGFFVNYIGSLINMVGQSKKIYQKDMRKLNRYLLKQYLPEGLKSNVRSHFFNKFKIEQVYDPTTEQTIMEKLTTNLNTQITETRNKRILEMSKFLKPITEDTVRKLSLIAKKMVFAPEQIIYSQKSKELKMWILQDGVVEQIPTFFNSKQDKIITVYDKDNQKTLGWINFITDKPYRTMARAKTFTLSYQIKQDDFFRVLKENELDYNKIHQLKQGLIQNNRLYISKCLSCTKFTHNVIDCPRIHFKSRGIFKILIQQKKEEYLRQQKSRKKHGNRSKVRFNWKALESFSQYTPQVQAIVMKFKSKSETQEENSRRCSVDSFVHTLYRNKSSQQEKNLQKRSSEVIESNQLKNQNSNKVEHSELVIQINEFPADKDSITNNMDKVYLGQGNGYLEHHNFYEISKRFLLLPLSFFVNKNKI